MFRREMSVRAPVALHSVRLVPDQTMCDSSHVSEANGGALLSSHPIFPLAALATCPIKASRRANLPGDRWLKGFTLPLALSST